MYLLAPILAVTLTILLILEGMSFFDRPEERSHVRWFGALTLLLAAPVALLHLLLLNGSLVYSPEFAVAVVEGGRARIGFELFLAVAACAGGMLWHVARVSRHSGAARWPLALAVIIIAGLTVWKVQPLPDSGDPPLYGYDMWWPPLVVWMVICVTQSAWTLAGITGRIARAALTSIAVAVVALRALYRVGWSEPDFVDPGSHDLWLAVLGGAAIAAVALIACEFIRSVWRWRETLGWALQLKAYLARIRTLQLMALAQVAGVVIPVLALGRLLRMRITGPSLALSALVLAWVILAEAFGGEPLVAVSRWPIVRQMRATTSPLRTAIAFAYTSVSSAARSLLAWIRKVTTGDPERKVSYPSVLLKALIGLAILIALSDIPNAGRTIIYPFDPGDLPDQAPLAREFPVWVLSEIAVLQRELAPLMIAINRQDQQPQLVAAATGVNSVDAALAKSSDLEYGSVKIPLSLLVVPIQTPLRKTLGARVISGTLHGDRNQYSVVATSTAGESWRSDAPAAENGVPLKAADALNTLAHRLAFEIVATSIPPGAGLTRSAEAFEAFRRGLDDWKQYEEDNWDALPRAIEDFRSAVRKDPAFSLAHYRLGVALEQDGRPAAAAEAFAASTESNPTFAPGLVARGYALYYFDDYRRSLTDAAAVDATVETAAATTEQEETRLVDARRLWRQVLTFDQDVVSVSDRASSYFGLCSDAGRHGTDERQRGYVAYYYCRRAEELYARMNSTDPQIANTHASVLNELGVILEQRLRTMSSSTAQRWHCSSESIDWKDVADHGRITERQIAYSPYMAEALQYYQRALALNSVDAVIRCNAASAAYALGDPAPMQALEMTSEAHRQLGDSIPHLAPGDEAVAANLGALGEFTVALQRDPADIDARNNFAYRYWEWQFAAANGTLPSPPEAVGVRAEEFAREASRLAVLSGARRSRQVLLQSTLGEVLLGRGRPHEAIDELKQALDRTPEYTLFDQIRWDLAQAYKCAAAFDRDHADRRQEIDAGMEQAERLLTAVHQRDRDRETPKPDDRQWLDLARPSPACLSTGAEPIPPAGFELTVQKTSAHEPCAWLGVNAEFNGADPRGTRLRVWGGGIDESVAAGDSEYVFLASNPRATHGYYFARLEAQDGAPVSPAYSVDTFANDGPNRCSRNLVTLVFAPKEQAAGTAALRSSN